MKYLAIMAALLGLWGVVTYADESRPSHEGASVRMSTPGAATAAPAPVLPQGVYQAQGEPYPNGHVVRRTPTQDTLQRAQLRPRQHALIAAGISAEIATLDAREGQRVKKGDTLATLDCSSQRAAKAVAQAKLASANAKKATHLRMQELQSISDLEVKLSISEADMAAAELQAINATLEKCVILAPFCGTVTRQDVQAHQYVREGDPLLELTSSDDLEIEMILPSGWLAWLEEGTPFRMKITETGKTIEATVASIGGKIDPISQTVRVIGKPTQSNGLLPGMSGSLLFDVPES